jgi:hypothetical protein
MTSLMLGSSWHWVTAIGPQLFGPNTRKPDIEPDLEPDMMGPHPRRAQAYDIRVEFIAPKPGFVQSDINCDQQMEEAHISPQYYPQPV